MKSAILTSPETILELKQQKRKRHEANTKKSTPKKSAPKNSKPRKRLISSSSSDSEDDLCPVCEISMPKNQTRNNTIACNTCGIAIHFEPCANMGSRCYYTCKNCDSVSEKSVNWCHSVLKGNKHDINIQILCF